MLLEPADDDGGSEGTEQADEEPREPVPQPAGDGLLGRLPSALCTSQIAAESRHVFVVLREQHPQHAVRRNEPNQSPVLVDDRDARLPAADHLPCDLLLVGARFDDRGVEIHDVGHAVGILRRQHPLDRQHPHEHPVAHDRDVVGALEPLSDESAAHVRDQVVGMCSWDARGHMVAGVAKRETIHLRLPHHRPMFAVSDVAAIRWR